MILAQRHSRSWVATALFVLIAVVGAILALHIFVVVDYLRGARHGIVALVLEHFPILVALVLADARSMVWSAVVFGVTTAMALTHLAWRMARLSWLPFACLSACIVPVAWYPVVFVTDPFLHRALHYVPSFFVAIGAFAFALGAFVHWWWRRPPSRAA